MLTTPARRSTRQLAAQFQGLKSRTLAAEGTDQDLNPSPDTTYLRDREDMSSKDPDLKEMVLTTDSKGFHKSGTYFQFQTMSWHGETTMNHSIVFQERPDGLVESLEQIDPEGNGKPDVVNRQVFDPARYEGFNISNP